MHPKCEQYQSGCLLLSAYEVRQVIFSVCLSVHWGTGLVPRSLVPCPFWGRGGVLLERKGVLPSPPRPGQEVPPPREEDRTGIPPPSGNRLTQPLGHELLSFLKQIQFLFAESLEDRIEHFTKKRKLAPPTGDSVS